VTVASTELTVFLVDAGSVASGGAALVGTAAFVVASFARDLGAEVDPIRAAERGALFGAVGGLLVFAYQRAGVH
jgi:hypothetical protein